MLAAPGAAISSAGGGPANDMFASAQTLTGASGQVAGTNAGASLESGESTTVSGAAASTSIWYVWTAPDAGVATFDTVGSSFDTLLGVYTGTAVNALAKVGENDDIVSRYQRQSWVSFNVSAGQQFMIRVDGFNGATGSVNVDWKIGTSAAGPPPNDMFAAAQELGGASGTTGGTNVDASREPGEPQHATKPGYASVWYRWTPSGSGTASFSTAGSPFDTLLAVYTGVSVGSLTAVASNDDVSTTDKTSRVSFDATAGTTYLVAVDGWFGPNYGQAIGPIALTWSFSGATPPPPSPPPGPPNDLFASAQPISGASGTVTGTNVGATLENGEPAGVAGAAIGASIWYRWTAPYAGTVAIDTIGSPFDTTLGVYTGSSVGALTVVAANDDIVPRQNRVSRVTFTATSGVEYMIQVAGWASTSGPQTGSVTVNWGLAASSTPAAGSDPVVLAAGDIAKCPVTSANGASRTALILGQYPTAKIANLGDSAYEDGTDAEYASCYAPTWGQYKDRTSPTVGYHDYNTPNAAGYFTYWGGAAGTQGQGWYSYDLGGWHVVVLNSPLCDQACSSTSQQIQWLNADLSAHRTRCTLAYFAFPLFTSGTTDGPDPAMRNFWNVLYNANVDLILNGHEHNYERFAPQTPSGKFDSKRGIREFVVGTGGRSLYPFGSPARNSEVRFNTDYGVLRLALHSGSYDWQYLSVGGAFTDSGSTTCH